MVFEIERWPAHDAVGMRRVVPADALGAYFGECFPVLDRLREASGIDSSAGSNASCPRAYYFAPPGDFFDLAASFPLTAPEAERIAAVLDGPRLEGPSIWPGVELFTFPAMKVAKMTWRGSYDELATAWGEFELELRAAGFIARGDFALEEYAVMPSPHETRRDPVTNLYWAI